MTNTFHIRIRDYVSNRSFIASPFFVDASIALNVLESRKDRGIFTEMFDLVIIDRPKTWIALLEGCFFFFWLSSGFQFRSLNFYMEYRSGLFLRNVLGNIIYVLKSLDDSMNIKRCENFYFDLINKWWINILIKGLLEMFYNICNNRKKIIIYLFNKSNRILFCSILCERLSESAIL